mmetsp:Transcript_25313/g.58806  ORF Transcript_25313/g.58806 Transcript_25313/m.58806 type:complete len:1001 (-) Transcript_25313:112-3114(-)
MQEIFVRRSSATAVSCRRPLLWALALVAILSQASPTFSFVPTARNLLAAASAVVVAGSAIATPLPSLAEEDALAKDLQAKIVLRDQALKKITSEKNDPFVNGKRLRELQKEEEQLLQQVERLRIEIAERDEQSQKDSIDGAERIAKAQIDKEERLAKAEAEKTMQAQLKEIKANEKSEIAAVKKDTQAKRKEIVDLERKERRAAKTSAERDAAVDKAEKARDDLEDQAEADIIAATKKAEDAIEAALEAEVKAKEAAVEKGELLRKGVTEQAEIARRQAAERAEQAEKAALTEEEQAQVLLAATIEQIELGALEAENEALIKFQEATQSVASALAPVVIPGVLLAVYAVIASFFAAKPEPALGAESDEARVKMGRKPRSDTKTVKLDYWVSEEEQLKAGISSSKKSKVSSTVGAAGLALLASQLTSGGLPTFVHTGRQTATSRTDASLHQQAGQRTHSSWGHQSSGTYRAAAAAGGAAVMAACHLAGARRLQQRSKASPAQSRASTVVRLGKQDEISEENPLRVIVSGAGVGGLLLAKALSKEPTIDLVVLEQTSSFARFGGPIQLASNALSVIRQVDEELFNELMTKFTFTGCRKNGLVDALRTEWYCPFDAMETAADSFELPYTGVVDRPDLQELLLDSLPEGTVNNAKRVAGYKVLPNNEGVEVVTEDGKEYKGDVLIGADGIWSATRAQMWNEERKGDGSGCTYSGYIVFAGETLYQPEDYFDVGYKVYMGPKRYFVCSDVGRGRIQWYAFCGVPENVEIPSDYNEKKAYVMSSFQGWSSQILELIDATPATGIEDRSLYDRPPSVLRSWADGPVALMGDACHPMMPNLGQGGCQAMEDAFKITENLRNCKRRSQVPEALQDYYRSRVVRSAIVQGLSRLASDLLLSTFTFPWKPSEGLSAPYGADRGDFQYDSVLVNYLRYLLPGIFNAQFTYLYSYHPFKWTKDEVKQLVGDVMDRHRQDAEAAWAERMEAVERGESIEEEVKESFFKLSKQEA